MDATSEREWKLPLSQQRIADDAFAGMRRENLSRWPTGRDVDLDEAVALHQALPKHKQLAWVLRRAVAERRCLTQPRGGFGTFALQLKLMETLDKEGLADVVPTTTDSYTRNEQFALAQRGVEESEREGRSMLNGYPLVNYGVAVNRRLIEAIDKPAIMLTGTAMPRLTGEIGFASGYSGYLGSGIAYTTSYTKEMSIEDGIRNYQYLDRLAALYQERGVELHRRQPGFLTGTNIPPCIAIMTAVLDALLAAAQGVRNYGLELGQTLHLIQDAAAIAACGELVQEYLVRCGHRDVFTSVTSLHWMGAWPHDDAQSAALVAYGGTLAAIGGAVSVTTKTTHEAFGLPTPEINAEGLRMTRMAIYLARHIRLDGLAEFQFEKELIGREVRPIVDKVLEMGDGDVAIGTVRAFAGRRHGHSLVAESAGEEPGHAGAGCRGVPAHPRAGPDAVPEGRARGARGAAARARRPRRHAVQRRAGGRERLRALRAAVEAHDRQVDAARGVKARCTVRSRTVGRSREARAGLVVSSVASPGIGRRPGATKPAPIGATQGPRDHDVRMNTLSVRVWRSGKDGSAGAFVGYEVPRLPAQTVLDVVTHIQRRIDATLAYRFACRVGMCGSCAMSVNGRARWTCRTHVEVVAGDGDLEIAPLANLPVIRDLVTDMREFFDKWARAKGQFVPTATRDDDFARIAPASKERRAIDAAIECIGCGVCYASCDVVGWNGGVSRSGGAEPGMDARQRRARWRARGAPRRGRRGCGLPRLPYPSELHRPLPEAACADRVDRRAQAIDGTRRAAGGGRMRDRAPAPRTTAIRCASIVGSASAGRLELDAHEPPDGGPTGGWIG